MGGPQATWCGQVASVSGREVRKGMSERRRFNYFIIMFG